MLNPGLIRVARFGPWLFLCGLLAACSPPPIVQQQAFVFGTLVELSVLDDDRARASTAMASVLARFDELHGQLHAWQPSELSRLNAALARGRPLAVTPELGAMLRDAQTLSIHADGLFNPAIGHLIALWGFHSDAIPGRTPEASAILKSVDAAPRMSDLRFDGDSVSSSNPSVQLDLGGYAKGRALDEAVAILKSRGIRNALVNIGGNVIALGQHGDRPWRVGIQHPREPGALATIDLYDGEAIGTSGDYQRYFEVDGRRYCHLIDPRTGYPAKDMQSLTILVSGERAGTRSDALSKPLFIGGPAALAAQAATLGVTHYLAVDATGKIYRSPAMQARLR
ncbi:MAG: FAD:protein FMN transferase [Thiobacillus sp.]|nr:FAD:protein FMN transferase [Thiobacillus sp.]